MLRLNLSNFVQGQSWIAYVEYDEHILYVVRII